MDGVTSISLRARGATWRGNLVRNAFYLQANALGGHACPDRHADRAPATAARSCECPCARAAACDRRTHSFRSCPASCRQGIRRPEGRRTRPGPAFWGRRAGRLVLPAGLRYRRDGRSVRGRSSMVERWPSKPSMRVRFPSPASGFAQKGYDSAWIPIRRCASRSTGPLAATASTCGWSGSEELLFWSDIYASKQGAQRAAYHLKANAGTAAIEDLVTSEVSA